MTVVMSLRVQSYLAVISSGPETQKLTLINWAERDSNNTVAGTDILYTAPVRDMMKE